MTDEQTQALVKECGLDWQRGFMPLFDGDPTNRYAVLVEAATAPLLMQIEQLEALVKTLELQSSASIKELNERSARIAALEAKLAQRVQDGWPTNEMIEAGRKAADSHGPLLCNGQSLWHIFRDMLSAAPAAPEQQEPTEPAKTDHRKLQLQGLILASMRLGLAQPSEALLHQLDRLIDFYEDDKFADALRLLRHSVRNPKPAGRRIPLVPSAAPAAPEQQDPKILQRADDLHNKAGMPWDEAEKLALEEAGIGDAEIDELIGNCSPDAVVSLLNEEDVRVFARSILVHQHVTVAQAPNAQQAEPRDAHFGGSSYEASMLRNLLARIHGDGGHYVAQHGLEKAMEDADQLCAKWRAQQAEAQEPFAWSVFDGEGGHDLVLYAGNEDYRERFEARNPNQKNWVEPLFTRPQSAQLQALSDGKILELIEKYWNDPTTTANVFAQKVQSALAAKNGAVLK